MKRKRLVVIIVLAGVFLMVGCGAVVGLVLVPALTSAGVSESLARIFRLSSVLNDSGLVDGATVTVGRNVSGGRTTRLLKVECRWVGAEPADETAATRVAAIVLDSFDDIANVDRLAISFRQGVQVGPISLRQLQSFEHTLTDWRARRQRLAA